MAAVNNKFTIEDVRLAIGSDPIDTEVLPMALELARCRRYYTRMRLGGQSPVAGSFAYYQNFPVPMRVAPTASVINVGSLNSAVVTNDAANLTTEGFFFQFQATVDGGNLNGRIVEFSAKLF
ncbi:hypothetical protein [Rhizobium sp. 23-156E]